MSVYKATIMNEADIERVLKRISHEIIEKNNGSRDLCLIGIRRRGMPLASVIANNISQAEKLEIDVGFIDITFYRDDLKLRTDEPVIKDTQIAFDVNNKKVVLVDDVLYTGRTARAAIDAVMTHGRPSCIQLAVLIDRGHRELPIRGDYVGKNVPTAKSEHIAVKLPPFDEITAVELYG